MEPEVDVGFQDKRGRKLAVILDTYRDIPVMGNDLVKLLSVHGFRQELGKDNRRRIEPDLRKFQEGVLVILMSFARPTGLHDAQDVQLIDERHDACLNRVTIGIGRKRLRRQGTGSGTRTRTRCRS